VRQISSDPKEPHVSDQAQLLFCNVGNAAYGSQSNAFWAGYIRASSKQAFISCYGWVGPKALMHKLGGGGDNLERKEDHRS
jgi:hypothetical protein